MVFGLQIKLLNVEKSIILPDKKQHKSLKLPGFAKKQVLTSFGVSYRVFFLHTHDCLSFDM
jgi:hypothetical protein